MNRPIFTVRLHCELPFLAQISKGDGMSMETLTIARQSKNVTMAAQSRKMARDMSSLLGREVLHLPSTYAANPSITKRPGGCGYYDDVGCFGAVRLLKNHLAQAVAAIRFSKERNKKLRFHINGEQYTPDGAPVLAALKVLFAATPETELVLHPWMPHEEFLKLLTKMTIGLQVSLTEASNVVTKDMKSVGLPIVVSREIKNVSEQSIAYPTDTAMITERMHYAMAHPELVEVNRRHLAEYNAAFMPLWSKLLKNTFAPRVLFLVQQNPIDTGINTSTSNDAVELKKNGVYTEVVKTGWKLAALRHDIDRVRPTHVVAEAMWEALKLASGVYE